MTTSVFDWRHLQSIGERRTNLLAKLKEQAMFMMIHAMSKMNKLLGARMAVLGVGEAHAQTHERRSVRSVDEAGWGRCER